MLLPKHIIKRDGSIDLFEPSKIREAISGAVRASGFEDYDKVTEEIFQEVKKRISEKFNGNTPKINEIEKIVIKASYDIGYKEVSLAYSRYSHERAEARKFLAIHEKNNETSTTDAALLIESNTHDKLQKWNREKIVEQLKSEANLSHRYAEKIAKRVENSVIGLYKRGGIRKFSTTDIRILVDMILKEEGLETQRKKQAILGLPSSDFIKIVFSRSKENSNIAANNPEAVNLEVAERIQKPWALSNIFSEEVANAHLKGEIHLHDLGYPTRVYCSSHSVEYLKKYGLGKVLENLESKSNPPNSAAVLNQHIQTFLASMQAHYAGALGFGFLNILYSSLLKRPVNVVYGYFKGEKLNFEKRDYEKLVEQGVFSNEIGAKNYFEITEERMELKEVPLKEFEQVAQNLIFASSQNAFSRGGQTLFIDFNIHTGVPSYLKEVPAIGPGGKYMILKKDGTIARVDSVPRVKTEDPKDIRNGDADSSKLTGEFKDGKIVTYGDLEETSQKFAKALLEIWRKGDSCGRPFHFPKCDLHVDENTFKDPKQLEILELATQVSSENGAVYFMFDRGNGAVLAQCCRLREKIEDSSMLKYPERLRFCGFQNVTINLAQAAYKGKNLDGTLEEIDRLMEIAFKAHKEKAKFMQQLLETDGSPMRNLGKPSDDGTPYIELRKATYIIGNIGLNEAVQVITGQQLHESQLAYETGLKIIAFMYKKIQEFKKRSGRKFTLEETPAESTTRRLAKLDRENFEIARKIVKGTEENPYYTNSIHFAPDADVSIIDRIVGQSKFHDMIESGAIIHAYVGEKRPSKEAIMMLVKKTFENTRCSQLVISPTYTECNVCGNIMAGEKNLCTNADCSNAFEKTVNRNLLNVVTRIVGYYSGISKWNSSQRQIYEDRKKAVENYAGSVGRDMSFLYYPENVGDKIKIYLFGKHGCSVCEKTNDYINEQINNLGIKEKIEYQVYYLDDLEQEAIVKAAKYSVPFDSVPTVVVVGKESYWKKTAEYGIEEENCNNGVCSLNISYGKGNKISPEEIKNAIIERISRENIVLN
ncbi:MAG: anaerobic ribonucleoside-triphosphate reductase [Candidatus Pacearchaeota archaeon]